MDDTIYMRYKDLACNIIKQEIDDYLHNHHYYRGLNRREADQKLYHFCTTNEWFNFIDLDGEYLYAKVLKMRNEGRKNVWQKQTKRSLKSK